MRDFTNGRGINVGGDFFITDQSHQHKLLVNCTSEELIEEERFRHNQLARERAGKFKRGVIGVAVIALFFFFLGVYFWYTGKMERFDLFTAVSGISLTLSSLQIFKTSTVVEQRHLNALQEIDLLLRERAVR